MSKRSRACEFSPDVRNRIRQRDETCIFCRGYGYSGFPASQIAHFVGRAQGGLGIEKNGAYVCVLHHQQLDNGTDGKRMRSFFEGYLRESYPDWNKEDLIYDKWSEK